MSIDIKDSIGVTDNLITEQMCSEAIDYFKREQKLKKVFDRFEAEGSSSLIKDDMACNLGSINVDQWSATLKPIFLNFFQAWAFYRSKTGIDTFYRNGYHIDTPKIQKTVPGGGYHIWHIEHAETLAMVTRVMFFIIYLNDDFEAGETEFLNAKRRVKPKTGRIILAPAHYPYVHRGNPPINGTKYVITGWIHCLHK